MRKLIEDVYRRYDLPDNIISDCQSMFMSRFSKELFGKINVKISLSTAYLPLTDRQTKIVNRMLEQMLRCLFNYDKDNWDWHFVEF